LLKDELYKKDRLPMMNILSQFSDRAGFDAADFLFLGNNSRPKSHVTNKSGIEWLRHALGDEYNIYP
jgi:hypothetical protein